jgi:hypothetical protein
MSRSFEVVNNIFASIAGVNDAPMLAQRELESRFGNDKHRYIYNSVP